VKETVGLILEGKFDNAVMICNSCHAEQNAPSKEQNSTQNKEVQ